MIGNFFVTRKFGGVVLNYSSTKRIPITSSVDIILVYKYFLIFGDE